MELTSLTYVFFLLVCIVLYYLLPKQFRIYMLLLASAGFYYYAMGSRLLIMMGYIWIIFILGLLMKKSAKNRKLLAALGILLSVALLTLCKATTLISLMGVSYVTFQCIAYLVDICKKKSPIIKNPVWFFLYALFFVKITAGPIEPAGKFFTNLKECKDRPFSWNNSLRAILLIVTGFLKKTVIADMLAPGVANVFDASGIVDGLSAIIATIMYTIQIYYDFSGYTDIARGSALFFGFNLTENFKSPYSATSVVEFWRRWHISLSDWLKNYIYIPLGGSRVGTLRRYLNVFITFLVSGIWHGASLTFIFWGILHGIYQILEMLFKPLVKNRENYFYIVFSKVRTFIMVAFAWIFFRASTLSDAFRIIKSLFTSWAALPNVFDNCILSVGLLVIVVVSILVAEFMTKRLAADIKPTTNAVIISCTLMLWLIIISMLFVTGSISSSFIYFNF